MSRIRDLAGSGTVATLVFLGPLVSRRDPENRFLYQWDQFDGMALALCVAALTILGFACARLGRRCGGAVEHLMLHAHMLVFAFGLVSAVPWLHGPPFRAEAASLVVIALVSWSWGMRMRLLPLACYRIAVAFSPLPVILIVQVLLWPPWSDGAKPNLAPLLPTPASGDRPVVVLVFDEWSYQRTFHGQELIPGLNNLRLLAADSAVFHAARSPGLETRTALPKLLYQPDSAHARLVVDEQGAFWDLPDGVRIPTAEAPSLIKMFQQRNYETRMLGFYLPYPYLVGETAHRAASYGFVPKGEGVLGRMGAFLLEDVYLHLLDPLSRRFGPSLFRHFFSKYWYWMNRDFLSQALALLAPGNRRSLVFLHWPLPHGPFIFDADGGYRGPFKSGRTEGVAIDYHLHLLYLDKIVGSLLAVMREAGTYDEALIIATSDHAWREDRELDMAPRGREAGIAHVPLIVKWPGSRTRRDVDADVRTDRLRPLLANFLDGRGDLDTSIRAVVDASLP